MLEGRPTTRVFVTMDPVTTGRIIELDGVIDGDAVHYVDGDIHGYIVGEGRAWHRKRWAAESYAQQLQFERLRYLRGEVDRVERLDFRRSR